MSANPQIAPAALESPVSPAVGAVTRAASAECPQALGLILTGSAARGEATIAVTGRGSEWLSDAEFLVVVDDSAGLRSLRAGLDALAARISSTLAREGVYVAVELTPAPERYFASIRPHLFGYELMTCGRRIHGEVDYLARIRPFHWSEIPPEDAWRLVSNRMVEWLEHMVGGRQLALSAGFYVLAKQYLDLVTSLALFSGYYAPSYAERAANLPLICSWVERNGIDIPLDGFEKAVRMAMLFKQDPLPGFDWLWDSKSRDLPAAMEAAGCAWLYSGLAPTMGAIWKWEAARLARARCRRPVDANAIRRIYGFRERARGWARLLVHAHGRSKIGCLGRGVRLFPGPPPRALVYCCAARLLDPETGRAPETLEWVRRHLPVAPGRCSKDWNDLGLDCVQAWTRFLRRSGT